MRVLLDTHIWIWNLAGSERMPERFRAILSEEATEAWLSPISVWEATILAARGRISLLPDPETWVEEALARWPVKEARLSFAVAMRSHKLGLPHQDPADRFIAATALVYGLHLMTLDQRLLDAQWLPTVAP